MALFIEASRGIPLMQTFLETLKQAQENNITPSVILTLDYVEGIDLPGVRNAISMFKDKMDIRVLLPYRCTLTEIAAACAVDIDKRYILEHSDVNIAVKEEWVVGTATDACLSIEESERMNAYINNTVVEGSSNLKLEEIENIPNGRKALKTSHWLIEKGCVGGFFDGL